MIWVLSQTQVILNKMVARKFQVMLMDQKEVRIILHLR